VDEVVGTSADDDGMDELDEEPVVIRDEED